LNTFLNCIGHVSTRQGEKNVWRSNWWKGQKKGVNSFGPHNKYIGNILENCQTGIHVMAGDVAWDAPQSQKNDNYPQSNNVLLAGNEARGTTPYLCKIGETWGNSTLPALNTRIEGWASSKGNITYGKHQGAQGPFAATTLTWPQPVLLGPADVGPEAGL
jgi:hypothetical protein